MALGHVKLPVETKHVRQTVYHSHAMGWLNEGAVIDNMTANKAMLLLHLFPLFNMLHQIVLSLRSLAIWQRRSALQTKVLTDDRPSVSSRRRFKIVAGVVILFVCDIGMQRCVDANLGENILVAFVTEIVPALFVARERAIDSFSFDFSKERKVNSQRLCRATNVVVWDEANNCVSSDFAPRPTLPLGKPRQRINLVVVEELRAKRFRDSR